MRFKMFSKTIFTSCFLRRSLIIFILCMSCSLFLLVILKMLLTDHHFSKEESSLTTICSIGRLGNQLFVYATLIGVARFNHRKPLVPSCNFKQLEKYFQITHGVINSNGFHYSSLIHTVNLTNFTVPSENSNFKVEGRYPVSYFYFDHVRNEILRQFRFRSFVSEYADGVLRKVRKDRDEVTFVGVHVRRTDYPGHLCTFNAKYEASSKFYQKAMEIFRKNYSKVAFVVASDDPDWTKANVQGDDVYYIGNKTLDPVFDLAVLARCNHTIFAYGTFGFWAAYLSGGQTIYMINQIEKYPVKQEFLFRPDWIGIDEGIPLKCKR